MGRETGRSAQATERGAFTGANTQSCLNSFIDPEQVHGKCEAAEIEMRLLKARQRRVSSGSGKINNR